MTSLAHLLFLFRHRICQIVVGLLASFVQSLGLTIQRKSHLANEALPPHKRTRDAKRPLWLLGFLIFLTSNLFGTIFQLGALPIIVLGPLGAVSLLWNAFFARFILGDSFSIHIVAGIILIAGGACLIAIFGVVPEQTHTLPELVALYTRTPFLVWATLLSIALVSTLTLAHLAEWALERRIASKYPDAPPLTPKSIRTSSELRRFTRRASLEGSPRRRDAFARKGSARQLHGSVGSLNDSSGGLGSGRMRLDLRNVTFKDRTVGRTDAEEVHRIVLDGSALDDEDPRSPGVQHDQGNTEPIFSRRRIPGPTVTITPPELDFKDAACLADVEAAIERSRLILGVAYGAASGTLSGLCLLFAKTGIELLIQTIVVRQNQFGHFEAWAIVAILAVAAVCQLFYLNRALRLVGPTLICPLAFCFYNLSSIITGLIYYDQWDQLTSLQFGLVALGTAILLGGVWIVSIRSEDEGQEVEEEGMGNPYQPLFLDEPGCYHSDLEEGRLVDDDEVEVDEDDEADSETEDDFLDLDEDAIPSPLALPVEWIPRGLTIGLGAASPGFDLRPATRRASQSVHLGGSGGGGLYAHRRKTSLPTTPFNERESNRQGGERSNATAEPGIDGQPTPTTNGRSSSSTPNSPRRRATNSSNAGTTMTRSERAMSLSGNLYVGRCGNFEDAHSAYHQHHRHSSFATAAVAAQAWHRVGSGAGMASPTTTTMTSATMPSGMGATDEEETLIIPQVSTSTISTGEVEDQKKKKKKKKKWWRFG
ncbi:BQ5605_C002g01561 [Microbotryum silenes-dioicae]|uniref:BQ5605_C002g01561 protein n=1 Tax=Microbotryum silenes-dioicae TaxID=796604 RepID=A0A2X0M2Z9_9BASI|nr:BQ5605_C002g01561 [Microbotryum silenes-dioicae]